MRRPARPPEPGSLRGQLLRVQAWAQAHPVRAIGLGGLAVVGFAALAGAADVDSASASAREFMSAAIQFNGIRVSELTCEAKLKEVQGFVSAMAVMIGSPEDVRGSVDELSFEEVQRSGESATVRVAGRLTVAVRGVVQSVTIVQSLAMKYERGRWRYCGEPASGAATPAPTATPEPRLTTTEIAAIGRSGTVMVEHSRGHGSGAYLGQDRVLTADHVIAGASGLQVTFAGSVVGPAQVLRRDATNDLALLSVPGLEGAGARALGWGDSSTLQPGDQIVVIGYPGSVGLTVTNGIVSGLKRMNGIDLVQTDAAVNQGNSGGPLLNGKAELVGIADFKITAAQGLNFAVASKVARPFVEGSSRAPESESVPTRDSRPLPSAVGDFMRNPLRAWRAGPATRPGWSPRNA